MEEMRAELELFCESQIHIPTALPNILKQYTKAAIRTQPKDLLMWSAAYFRAMANGEKPPVKERLEFPDVISKDGVSIGLLRALHDQVGGKERSLIPYEVLKTKWQAHCLEVKTLNSLLDLAGMADKEEIEWPKFLGILAGTIATNLAETMTVVCQVITEKPDGTEPTINYEVWWQIYIFLIRQEGKVDKDQVRRVNMYLIERARNNDCLIGPSDFNSPNCPTIF